MSAYEVEQPILNSPSEEPGEHWLIQEGHAPKREAGRRRAGYFYRDPKAPQPELGEPAGVVHLRYVGGWVAWHPRPCGLHPAVRRAV